MNTNHVFPQVMLTAVTLVGDRTGDGVLELELDI